MISLVQQPCAGSWLVKCCGDTVRIELSVVGGQGGNAFVRTNLGGGAAQRQRLIDTAEECSRPSGGGEWRDIAMVSCGTGRFICELPITQTGVYEAKCCYAPQNGRDRLWVAGENLHIKAEPACTAGNNTIYNAFVRQFGRNRAVSGRGRDCEEAERFLDGHEYTVIPPSGRFRDLCRELSFIMDQMGFRIIQLLPVQPPPVTYARMGRYGSPFAPIDYFSVDTSLAVFDRKSTPLEQFIELVDAVHARGGLMILDLPIDHTGWASTLQVHQPDWFCRNDDGSFASPGAWGVVWEDLCKLDFTHHSLWKYMAEVFLHWTQLGVDGFRCDAGYMIPADVWKYITARVRNEYPDTVFFLEGLGGDPRVTTELLRTGGMDWAYSELFQQFGPEAVRGYLASAFQASEHEGLAVNYAETHDNARLAARSKRWAAMRTALAALTAPAGAFGIANGVEWLATEKIDVHGASSLNWGASDNLVDFIARLNRILREHPAFGHGASCQLAGNGNAVGILRSTGVNHENDLLIAINVDENQGAWLEWSAKEFPMDNGALWDLVSGMKASVIPVAGNRLHLDLHAGQVVCLSGKDLSDVAEVSPDSLREQQLRHGVLTALTAVHGYGDVSVWNVPELARSYGHDIYAFFEKILGDDTYVPLVKWIPERDVRRRVTIPYWHFIHISHPVPFRVRIVSDNTCLLEAKSFRSDDGVSQVLLPPIQRSENGIVECCLEMTVFDLKGSQRLKGELLLIPQNDSHELRLSIERKQLNWRHTGLCTNEHGSYALARGRWGELHSKYDAFLAASLSDDCPVDRMAAFLRCRCWVVFQGFSYPLDASCQTHFTAGYDNALRWRFSLPMTCGQQTSLEIVLQLDRTDNCGRLTIRRLSGESLPYYEISMTHADDSEALELIVRPDVDWRVNHDVTRAYEGAEQEFRKCLVTCKNGFGFAPWKSCGLRISSSQGEYCPAPEWQYQVKLQEDAERALPSETDVFSPGYFRAFLRSGQSLEIYFGVGEDKRGRMLQEIKNMAMTLPMKTALEASLMFYIAKRNDNRTVIAGFPWFLDWGRDTLICLRGMIACGMTEMSRDIIRTFASFEERGTIPNMIHGKDSSDRATSDAPLWLFTAVEELAQRCQDKGKRLLAMDCGGRSLLDILISIVENTHERLPNGVCCDKTSGLIFSPSHYTWMDTNYPAGTPRQGYPVEIQILWIHALKVLEQFTQHATYGIWRRQAIDSVLKLFVLNSHRGLSDCLHGYPGQEAADCTADDAVRPNQLLAVSLEDFMPKEICHDILDVCQGLMIPGGNRSLDDRPLTVELPIWHQGKLLCNPRNPYVGHYNGDEDTRRKPAYHNGTAWGWTMPMFCEALLKTYGSSAVPAARCWLETAALAMESACIGHIPEIFDGDSPHTPRGCPAQAWSMAENVRLWKILEQYDPPK